MNYCLMKCDHGGVTSGSSFFNPFMYDFGTWFLGILDCYNVGYSGR